MVRILPKRSCYCDLHIKKVLYQATVNPAMAVWRALVTQLTLAAIADKVRGETAAEP